MLASKFGNDVTYKGQILVRTDSGITDIKGLKGKKFAFVDPLSASGTLYPSRPDLPNGVPTGVAVTVITGVIMPLDLETVGADATQVVVLGRFGKSSDGCRTGVGCSRELVIDHVGWTPRGAQPAG